MTNAYVVVDPALPVAPSLQIYEQIVAAIQSGMIATGALLPPVRQLAGDLNVAANTVAKAYTLLQDAGWAAGDGRRGTRVAHRLPTADSTVRRAILHQTVARCVATLAHRGYSLHEIADELSRYTVGAESSHT